MKMKLMARTITEYHDYSKARTNGKYLVLQCVPSRLKEDRMLELSAPSAAEARTEEQNQVERSSSGQGLR